MFHFLYAPIVDCDQTVDVAKADLRLRCALKSLHSFCYAVADI